MTLTKLSELSGVVIHTVISDGEACAALDAEGNTLFTWLAGMLFTADCGAFEDDVE